MTTKSFSKRKAVVITIIFLPIFLIVEGVIAKRYFPHLFDNKEPAAVSWVTGDMSSNHSYAKEEKDLIAARAAWDAAHPVDWTGISVFGGLLLIALLLAAFVAGCVCYEE